jgi:folate-binding protein YgfZ
VPHVSTTTPTTGGRAPSPLLAREGAVPDEGADAGVAWHHGDPVREQRLLLAGEAVTDLSHRGVVTVSGPDRLTWLDTLSTQWLRDLAPGSAREALVLSPHGHVEHALHLVDDGSTTWITVEPGAQDALVAHLQRMRFMLRVEVSDVTDRWAVLGQVPGGDEVGSPLPAWDDPWPRTADGGVRYCLAPDDEHPGAERPWREVLVPRDGLVAAVGERPVAGTWAGEALRVAAWRPRFGFETDHRTIPHEVDWLRTAVHLQKGCYRGQETVARVHNLGRPPRRLVLLHLDGSSHRLPERGAEVVGPQRPVGHLTSVVRHHELGPLALALVKRSTPVDAPLEVDGVAAAQEVVVAP